MIAVAIVGVFAAFAEETAPSSTQFGAQRDIISINGQSGFIIHPTKPATDGSKPWVWYAPTFIDQHPDESHAWMAKQLLDAGFAICGVEVGESYGSPAGRKTYSLFHDYVTSKIGLDERACLLPQSRGGLMLLSWASDNPTKVQCIAGIYTVCNIESYPGIAKAAAAYDVDASEFVKRLKDHNPIERTAPLARAKIPILFVHGDSDTVVPLESNSGIFVERCIAAGGNASVIVVRGKGHEVCPEFFQNRQFTDFLIARGKPSR